MQSVQSANSTQKSSTTAHAFNTAISLSYPRRIKYICAEPGGVHAGTIRFAIIFAQKAGVDWAPWQSIPGSTEDRTVQERQERSAAHTCVSRPSKISSGTPCVSVINWSSHARQNSSSAQAEGWKCTEMMCCKA